MHFSQVLCALAHTSNNLATKDDQLARRIRASQFSLTICFLLPAAFPNLLRMN
jgi:hypothetical protein